MTRPAIIRLTVAVPLALAVLFNVPVQHGAAGMTIARAGSRSSLGADAPLHPMGNGKIILGGFADGSLGVINPDGSGLRRLARCTTRRCGMCDAVWSPDGRRIAFDRATKGKDSFSVYVSVYVMNANGSGERRVASWEQGYTSCWGEALAWSPDGTRLAIARSRLLYVLDLKTGGMRRLTAHAWGVDLDPAWSPDGHRIAFARAFPCGSICPNLPYIVNVDGRGLRRLSEFHGELDCGGVLWSPDGRTIAFCASNKPDRLGIGIKALNKAIYAVNPDGSHLRLLVPAPPTGTNQQQTVVGWSPDGKHILYFTRGTGTALWVINANGTGRRVLYRAGHGGIGDATWSPDGKFIAFSAFSALAALRSGLFVMNADGRHLHRLAATGGYDLAWQPIP